MIRYDIRYNTAWNLVMINPQILEILPATYRLSTVHTYISHGFLNYLLTNKIVTSNIDQQNNHPRNNPLKYNPPSFPFPFPLSRTSIHHAILEKKKILDHLRGPAQGRLQESARHVAPLPLRSPCLALPAGRVKRGAAFAAEGDEGVEGVDLSLFVLRVADGGVDEGERVCCSGGRGGGCCRSLV